MLALGYSGYLMKSENVRLQIMTIAQGSKVLSISTSRLSNILIPVPCIEEQTKIVNFLSAIDNKINHCQSQIEKTEIWKKGLLQQMFV
jgi:type I restriction enzyme S subunit